MTLAVMALYADGPTRLTNIASWRVKETDRIAAMATELRKLGAAVVEGADFIEVTPPAALAAPPPSTPTTTTAWRCACRWPPSTRWPARAPAGLPVRILDPRCVAKTFPDYFEALFGVASADAGRRAGDHHRRPHRLGQGHAGRGAWPSALGYHLLDSGALYRATALAALQDGVAPDDEAGAGRAGRAAGPALRRRARVLAARPRTSATSCGAKTSARWPRACRRCRRCARRCTACNWPSAALPGLVADGRDMGTVVFPGATLKVFLTASAAAARRAAA